MLGLAVTLALAGTSATAAKAENLPEARDPAEQPPAAEMDPRLLAALEDFIDSLQHAHSLRIAEALDESLEDLRFLFGNDLPASAFEALEGGSQEAIGEASTQWRSNAFQAMGRAYEGKHYPDPIIDNLVGSLRQATENPEQLPDNFRITPDIPLTQTTTWRDTLARHLDKQQLTLLGKDITLDRDLLVKRYGPFARQSADRYRLNFSRKIQQVSSVIQSALTLDEKRAQQLETTVHAMIEAALEEIAEHHLDAMAAAEPTQRRNYLRQGYVSAGTGNVADPSESKAWRGALNDILTVQEQVEWKTFVIQRRSKAIDTGARLLVVVLDEILSFNDRQRDAMVTLLKRPAEKHLLAALTEPVNNFSINTSEVVRHVKSGDLKGFQSLLDDWQRAYWDEHLAGMENRHDPFREQEINHHGAETTRSPQLLAPGHKEEIIEAAITDYVLTAIAPHVALSRARYKALVKATTAITDLDEKGRATLDVAARGATEIERIDLVRRYDTHARRSAQGADAARIHKLLAELRNTSLGRASNASAIRLWNHTLKSVLDDAQRSAMEDSRLGRDRFRAETLGLVNAHLLATRCSLSVEQIDELATAVSEQLLLYSSDIDEVFKDSGHENRWYLNSYYNLVGLHMIPAVQFKEMVGDGPYQSWTLHLRSRGAGYWKRIQENHRQRIAIEQENASIKASANAQPEDPGKLR